MEHLDFSKIKEKIGPEKDLSKLTEEELLFYDIVRAIQSKSADDERQIIQKAIEQLKHRTTNFKTNENQINMKTSNRTWIGIAAGIAILVVAYFFLWNPTKSTDQIFSENFTPTKDYISSAKDNAMQYGMAGGSAESRDSLLKALQFYENNQYEEAMKILAPYVDTYPEDNMARFHLSLCQMYREKYAPALQNLSKLNTVSDLENLEDVKWFLALCYLKMVDGKKQAKVLFEQLVATDGKYAKPAKANLTYL
jgi:TolA-binding protein